MGGFVVIQNPKNKNDIQQMIATIKHRGPDVAGIFENKYAVLAQNYLNADIGWPDSNARDEFKYLIPVTDRFRNGLRICFDGQIGNLKELMQKHKIADGPFAEERLLLTLYQRYGCKMCDQLSDAIFAFVISDGSKLLVARDMLGIKTLFYGKKDRTTFLGSELKCVSAMTRDVFEFPPGCWMNANGNFFRYAKLPDTSRPKVKMPLGEHIKTTRAIIEQSVESRVDFNVPSACLLSGGIDSSVISSIANRLYKNRFGKNSKFTTFAMGLGETGDILYARKMATHIGSKHHELIVNLGQILSSLPDVIYHLESYDPSLVRSAVSNYLITRYAKIKGYNQLISGEGGDELFCGYHYLKDIPDGEIFQQQKKCLEFLHNNAALRLDRMNLCHSVRVVAPLISGKLLQHILVLPLEYKLMPKDNSIIEKWILRKAFEDELPDEIAWRLKQEFSQGSGVARALSDYFESVVSNKEYNHMILRYPFLRCKEEAFYFKLFKKFYGDEKAVATVAQWPYL